MLLRLGDQGRAVRRLQELLIDAGHSLRMDEHFGAATLAAVKAFQEREGLAVDGIVGGRTWAALRAERGGDIVQKPSAGQMVDRAGKIGAAGGIGLAGVFHFLREIGVEGVSAWAEALRAVPSEVLWLGVVALILTHIYSLWRGEAE